MKLILKEVKPEVAGVNSFIFTAEEPMPWKAGQFMHVMLPHEAADDRGTERWFTIASAPYEQTPMITTRLSDPGSTFKKTLKALTPGMSLETDYVDGDFVIEDTSKDYVFLAGGIGITPFHSILKEADHAGQRLKVNLIYANRDANVPYKAELDAFAQKNPSLKLNYITNPQRIDETTVRALVPDLMTPMFYVSGPEPMVKSLQQMLLGMGIPEAHIKIDDFPGYEAE
jgi:ferredoxin-NADP reductase